VKYQSAAGRGGVDRLGEGAEPVRLEGPKGSADIDLGRATGAAEAKVVKASLTAVIQDLHRGKNSGGPWRAVISAYV
jgi:hypothetical protein